MAAPHVTGAIALLLSQLAKSNRTANAAQIIKALSQTTQGMPGQWHGGQGYGLVDVEALLKAF